MDIRKRIILLFSIFLAAFNSFASSPIPSHDSVLVKGTWVHYFILGDGPPIVHLPGGPGMSHISLLPLADLINSRLHFRNIIIDFRGIGPSHCALNDLNVGYDPIAEDIEEVRKKLKIKKWIVSGHSQGGQFAMYYTLKHPDAVSKLILIASADADNTFQSYFGHSIMTHLAPEMKARMTKYDSNEERKKDPENAEFETKKALITAYFYDYMKATAFIDTLSKETYFALNSNPYFAFFIHSDGYASFNIYDQLRHIKVPTLIIQGRQDCLGAEIPLGLQQHIPGSRMYFIDACGHLPWLEQPQTLLNLLAAFLL